MQAEPANAEIINYLLRKADALEGRQPSQPQFVRYLRLVAKRLPTDDEKYRGAADNHHGRWPVATTKMLKPDAGRGLAMRLWNQATPIAGTAAESYLRETHGLALPSDVSPRVLRFHPNCPFDLDVRRPCLLALFRGIADDQPSAIMRVPLTPAGTRIDRKVVGLVSGSAIKFAGDVTTRLTIAEGIESALAGISKDFGPTWALGSDAAIARLPVIPGVRTLTILGTDGRQRQRAGGQGVCRTMARSRPPGSASNANRPRDR